MPGIASQIVAAFAAIGGVNVDSTFSLARVLPDFDVLDLAHSVLLFVC